VQQKKKERGWGSQNVERPEEKERRALARHFFGKYGPLTFVNLTKLIGVGFPPQEKRRKRLALQ